MTDLFAPVQPGERFHVHTIPLHLVDRLQKAYGLTTFIETGTCFGLTVEHVRQQFARVVTIELDPQLAADARWKFAEHMNVTVLEGDSAEILSYHLRVNYLSPALIWLDAHHSGGATAAGVPPIRGELVALKSGARTDDVIMIDDLLDFTGHENGYPTLEELIELVLEVNSTYDVRIDLTLRRGILVATPPRPSC